MTRGEDRTLALLEDSSAAAAGIQIKAAYAMQVAQDDWLEAVKELTVIHEYAYWWANKVAEARNIWLAQGKPAITPYQQGTLIK